MPAPTDDRRAAPTTHLVRVRTFDDRIALIQRQVWKTVLDRDIRTLSTRLVTQRCRRPDARRGEGGWCIAERDRWAEAVAVFGWVRAHVRYTGDAYGIDTYQTGRRTLELRAGDCDDFTILIASMLLVIGHPVRLKSIELVQQPEPGFSHIYPQVLVGTHQEWRALDASSSRVPGWEVSPTRIARHRLDGPVPRGAL